MIEQRIPERAQRFVQGAPISAKQLNRLVTGINRPLGVAPTKQVAPVLGPSVPIPTSVNWLLTVTTTAKYNIPTTIDTGTPVAQDLCLVVQNKVTDGVYIVQNGNWKWLGRLRASDTTNSSPPVIPLGTIIKVFDGASAPCIFVVGNSVFTPGS